MSDASLVETLQKVWGYQSFRYPQAEIINSLLAKQDTLVLMPTGGGKSLCFQLPALQQKGLSIVVSPLVALMENQVRQLKQKGIFSEFLHSQQSKRDRQRVLTRLATVKLLYIAPETLLSASIGQRLIEPDITVSSLIIDEAHCITQWGTTFRPSYTRLGMVKSYLEKSQNTKITLAAFTATADLKTQKAIINKLQLKQPRIFRLSPYRSNLTINVQTVWTLRGRKQAALRFIQQQDKKAGLVYVRTRKDSEQLATWLQNQQLKTVAYHAGVPNNYRREIEQKWLTGKIPVVVCTSAFGMGIDKSDCRWILHYQLPELLGEYLQEIGRSGRDGKPAVALALRSEPTGILDNTDKQRSHFFQQQIKHKYSQAQGVLQQLPSQGTIEMFPDPGAAISLAILHDSGLIQWQDPFSFKRLPLSYKSPKVSHHKTPDSQLISNFLNSRGCRWQYILHAYNFPRSNFACGHCDRCH